MHYIRDNLAVCGFDGIRNREDFAARGFHAQLQCTEHYDDWLSEYVEVLCAPFADGFPIPKETFRRAQRGLAGHWDSGSRILISCAAGQSRSVTMAIALLSSQARIPFQNAALDVIARVPGAYPHPNVVASAAAFSGQPTYFEQLLELYAAVQRQPPYPWSVELLREAADRRYA